MTGVPRRIFGVETEYGLTCASTDGTPAPLDADSAAKVLFEPVVRDGRSTNVFLPNGGRLYLDVGSHPEFATAECDTLPDLLAQDRAGGDMFAALAAEGDVALAEQGITGRLHLFKNNLDSAGNSYGCHENYLVRRRPDYRSLVESLVPFFISRQIVVGAGMLRSRGGQWGLDFSQRANQVWDAMSSATTRSRPIVNTRDEPHADVDLYRRMHVIVGDSNMAEGATLLKVAATDMLLGLVEAGERFAIDLVDPMRAIREISADRTGTVQVETTDGKRLTPLAIQRYYLDAVVAAYGEDPDPWRGYAIDLWRRGLAAVASGDAAGVVTELDWAAKERLLAAHEARGGATGASMRRLDLAYHDITASGLRGRLEDTGRLRRLTDPAAAEAARTTPPATTRAHLRGTFVGAARAARRDHAVDWVHLRLADPAQRTVMLTDPFAASDPRVDALLEVIDNA